MPQAAATATRTAQGHAVAEQPPAAPMPTVAADDDDDDDTPSADAPLPLGDLLFRRPPTAPAASVGVGLLFTSCGPGVVLHPRCRPGVVLHPRPGAVAPQNNSRALQLAMRLRQQKEEQAGQSERDVAAAPGADRPDEDANEISVSVDEMRAIEEDAQRARPAVPSRRPPMAPKSKPPSRPAPQAPSRKPPSRPAPRPGGGGGGGCGGGGGAAGPSSPSRRPPQRPAPSVAAPGVGGGDDGGSASSPGRSPPKRKPPSTPKRAPPSRPR